MFRKPTTLKLGKKESRDRESHFWKRGKELIRYALSKQKTEQGLRQVTANKGSRVGMSCMAGDLRGLREDTEDFVETGWAPCKK